jgi:hypothetical protein
MRMFVRTVVIEAVGTAAVLLGQWLGERLAEAVIDRFEGEEPEGD